MRFEVKTDLGSIIECNCSHCAIKSLLLTFVPATEFKVLAGEDALKEYRFNKHVIAHMFCENCGIEPFGRAKNKEGVDTVAVNIRCLDDIDLKSITLTPVDGKSW